MGAIQVTFHTEKLGNLSVITRGIGSWQDVVAKAQYYGIVGKRSVERYFASSTDAKFNLDVTYVQASAKDLAKALDSNAGVNIVVVKAKLLSDTLKSTKDEMKDVSKDEIAKVRDSALKAFADAQVQLDRLKAVADKYKEAQVQLEQLTK